MFSLITYAIVSFALLLALTIIACVLWLEKRPGHNIEDVGAYGELLQVESKQDEKMQGVVVHGEIMQDEDETHPYYTRNARPFRRITLCAPIQNENAPNTDAFITTAQEMDTGANFRIRRKIFLPSTPVVETAKLGESPVGSSLVRRSTGLLSRYGEIEQE